MGDQLKRHHDRELARLLAQFANRNLQDRNVQVAQRAFYDCLVQELDQLADFVVGHDRDLAANAMRQAWLAIFTTARTCNPDKTSIKTWAKMITARAAADALHGAASDKQSLSVPPVAGSTHQDVAHCLWALPSGRDTNDQLAVVVALDADLDINQTAQILSWQRAGKGAMAVAHVHAHIARASAQLASCVQEARQARGSDSTSVDTLIQDAMGENDRVRFEGQSFLWACGKLDNKASAWMQEMLSRHPGLHSTIKRDADLVVQLRQALVDAREQQGERALVSFEQVRRALQQVKPERVTGTLQAWWQEQARIPGRLSRWFLGVLLAVGVMIALQTQSLFKEDQVASEFRAIDQRVPVAVIEVVFKPEVPLADIRAQLSTLNMHIINGPDRTGLYEVEAARGDVNNGLQALRSNPLVLSAQVQDLRARDSR